MSELTPEERELMVIVRDYFDQRATKLYPPHSKPLHPKQVLISVKEDMTGYIYQRYISRHRSLQSGLERQPAAKFLVEYTVTGDMKKNIRADKSLLVVGGIYTVKGYGSYEFRGVYRDVVMLIEDGAVEGIIVRSGQALKSLMEKKIPQGDQFRFKVERDNCYTKDDTSKKGDLELTVLE